MDAPKNRTPARTRCPALLRVVALLALVAASGPGRARAQTPTDSLAAKLQELSTKLDGLSQQLQGPTITLDTFTVPSLRTPDAPGFVLLGVSPAVIQRPHTPRALALGFLSSREPDDILPRNYALEVAPYWFFPNRTLEFEEYYSPNPVQSALQTLALSLATTPMTDAEGTTNGTNLGVGLRLLPFAGRFSMAPDTAALSLLLDERLNEQDPDRRDSLRLAARDVALRIQEQLKNRTQKVGFSLEVAGAAIVGFPNDNVARRGVSRVGAWITPSYRLTRPLIDLLGVVRFMHDDTELLEGEFLDVGGRVLFENNQLTLSAEFLRQFVLDSPSETTAALPLQDTFRLNGTLEYKFNETMHLVATLGQNFDPTGQDDNTLIVLIGLSFGVGQPITINATRTLRRLGIP